MLTAHPPLSPSYYQTVQQLLLEFQENNPSLNNQEKTELLKVLSLGPIDVNACENWFGQAQIVMVNNKAQLFNLANDFDYLIIHDVIVSSRLFLAEDANDLEAQDRPFLMSPNNLLQSIEKTLEPLKHHLKQNAKIILFQEKNNSLGNLAIDSIINTALQNLQLQTTMQWGLSGSQADFNHFINQDFFKQKAQDINSWRMFAYLHQQAAVRQFTQHEASLVLACKTHDANAQGMAIADAWLWLSTYQTGNPQNLKCTTQALFDLHQNQTNGILLSQKWKIVKSHQHYQIQVEFPSIAHKIEMPYGAIESIALQFFEIATSVNWSAAQLAGCVNEFIQNIAYLRPDFDLLMQLKQLQSSPELECLINGAIQFYDVNTVGVNSETGLSEHLFSQSDIQKLPVLNSIDLRTFLIANIVRFISVVPCFAKEVENRHYTRLQLLENILSYLSIQLIEKDFVQLGWSADQWLGHTPLPHIVVDAQQKQAQDSIENLEQQLLAVQTQLNLQQQQAQVELSQALEAERQKVSLYVSQTYEATSSWRVTKKLRQLSELAQTLKMKWAKRKAHHLSEVQPVNELQQTTVLPRLDYRFWSEHFDSSLAPNPKGWMALSETTTIYNQPEPSIALLLIVDQPATSVFDTIETLKNQHFQKWICTIAIDASLSDFNSKPNTQTNSAKYQTTILSIEDFEKFNLLVQLDTRFQLLFLKDLDLSNRHNLPALVRYFLTQTTAPYVMSFDATTRLRPQALDLMLAKIHTSTTVQMVYADHDAYLMKGQRAEPNFKPDWNNELFYSSALCENALHSLSLGCYLMKREIWSLFCQSSTLQLRATDQLQLSLILTGLELINSQNPEMLHQAVVHLPKVLSHHQAKHLNLEQRQIVADLLQEHFQKLNRNATISLTQATGKINYPIQLDEKEQLPLVSIIIPTRNNYFLLKQCIESIIEKTSYKPYEIIIIDNGSNDETTLEYFKEVKNNSLIKVIRDNDIFNYSSLNNHAVELAKGQFIALLNDDIQVIETNWLHEMIAYAQQAHVGVVGAKLYYPNYTIQHAGVVLVGSISRHVHKGLTPSDIGYCSRAQLAQSYTAVTAACLVVKQSIYKQLNGLNSLDLTVGWNDIDFCLRVKEAGYENIWTPHAQLLHHESATRGQDISPEKRARAEKEYRYMQKRWGQKMNVDVAYNPNLTDAYDDFSYAWPPRGNI